IRKGRNAGPDHPRIRHGDNIRLQSRLIFPKKTLKVRTANFFFALNKNDKIQRKVVVFSQGRFDAKDVRQYLAFVVCRSPGKDFSVSNNWLKRRGGQEVQVRG